MTVRTVLLSSILTLAALVPLVACSDEAPVNPEPDPGGSDSGVIDAIADGGPATDSAPEAKPDAWVAVDTLLTEKFANANKADLPGMGFVVYDANDKKVFEKMYGDFAPDRTVSIASASKLVSGLVVFDTIAKGLLTLDSTTGQILGWTGPKATISMRHLLSFTSGMKAENTCASSPGITLADCVDTISGVAPVASPGTRFDYGSTHLHVAARMVEVATGKTWNTVFREVLGDPLGLPTEVTYYTAPRKKLGTTNPLVAGGLRASMNDYALLLATNFHRGKTAKLSLGNDGLFAEQAKEPFAVTIGDSPMAKLSYPYRYGFTSWLECATPNTGCDVLGSAGAFGFSPWYDRKAGYYAILAMEMTGGTRYSFPIEQELQPLVRAALGR